MSEEQKKHDAAKTAWKQKLQLVVDKGHEGRSPASAQELYAELQLMVDLDTSNEWFKHLQAWQAKLIPEHAIIRRVGTDLVWIVQKVYACARGTFVLHRLFSMFNSVVYGCESNACYIKLHDIAHNTLT